MKIQDNTETGIKNGDSPNHSRNSIADKMLSFIWAIANAIMAVVFFYVFTDRTLV